MDFPRFNQGAVGNLTYAHMNEVFQLLERLRPFLEGDPSRFMQQQEELLTARITASDSSGMMQWQEVLPTGSGALNSPLTWTTREGGRKSGAPTASTFEPAVAPPAYTGEGTPTTPVPMQVGSVAVLRKSKRMDGKQLWQAISSVAAPSSSVFAAKIVGKVARPPCASDNKTYRWLYDWDEVTANQASSYEWVTFSGSRFGRNSGAPGSYPPALNGAEVNCIVGCGGTAPSGLVESNAPLANGVVVQMAQLPNGLFYFSLGNTISVQCGGTP